MNNENLFTIRICRSSFKGFKKIQKERGTNRNALVNEAIAFYLAHQPELASDTEKAPA